MALVFCDGFDHYTTLTQKWDVYNKVSGDSGGIGTGYGRFGTSGFAISMEHSYIQKAIPSGPQSSAAIGVAFNQTAGNPGTNAILLEFVSGVNPLVGVAISPTNQLFAFTGQNPGASMISDIRTVLGYGTLPCRTAMYQYIELEVTAFDNVYGALNVYYNGVKIIELTDVDTAGATEYTTAEAVRIGGKSNGWYSGYPGPLYFDDFYLVDPSDDSGAGNTSHLGDVRVQELFPTNDGYYKEFTPSAGTLHFDMVDENPPDADTTYVEGSTLNLRDTYTFPSVTPTAGNVKGVVLNMSARKLDSGDRGLSAIGRLSTTDALGTEVRLGSAFVNYQSIMEKAPDGNAWTIAKVNSSQYGPKITT